MDLEQGEYATLVVQSMRLHNAQCTKEVTQYDRERRLLYILKITNMSQLGRIHCFLIATKGAGNVIYERFYDRLSEYEKADVRAAFQLASSNVRLGEGEQEDFIGVYK
jgi:hypothetical protein